MFFSYLRVSRYTPPNLPYRSQGEGVARGIATQAAPLGGIALYGIIAEIASPIAVSWATEPPLCRPPEALYDIGSVPTNRNHSKRDNCICKVQCTPGSWQRPWLWFLAVPTHCNLCPHAHHAKLRIVEIIPPWNEINTKLIPWELCPQFLGDFNLRSRKFQEKDIHSFKHTCKPCWSFHCLSRWASADARAVSKEFVEWWFPF